MALGWVVAFSSSVTPGMTLLMVLEEEVMGTPLSSKAASEPDETVASRFVLASPGVERSSMDFWPVSLAVIERK